MNENFLITWQGTEDETYYLMFPMSEYNNVRSISDKLASRPLSKTSIEDVSKMVNGIKLKSVKDHTIKTYNNEDWPFGEDNIKKIISLPEFGW